MENEELREKLLCAIKNNIADFKGSYADRALYFNSICLYFEIIEKVNELIVPPKYFWQKEKILHHRVKDYNTFTVGYGSFRTTLTKEEYEEIMQIRQEKIKEKQLKELEKLCNKEQN